LLPGVGGIGAGGDVARAAVVERRGLRRRGAPAVPVGRGTPAVPAGMRVDAREGGRTTRAIGCGRVGRMGGLGGVVGELKAEGAS
jgi:hypothetical protein